MNISVLMCVRNGERYIRETIDSILNQTYKDFEFIIVVNCSTDNTLDIINEYKDERIKVYETNIGQLTYNLNFGLGHAEGDYIARIDADDIAKPNRLEKQISFIKKHGIDVIGSNIDYIDEQNHFLKTKYYPEQNKDIRKKIIYQSVLAHPSVMFRKSLVLDNGGYLGGRYSEDYALWLKLMRDKRVKFFNIQESLTNYRIHNNQARGNKIAFAEVSGYLLIESVFQRKVRFLMGALVNYLKVFLR